MPGSEKAPAGWPGWPDGKKFALVLTHDVENRAGLRNCRRLMELEVELGFRSSFNLIPEGDYEVSNELRDELTSNGFEVGVHDLKHDGRLFLSRRDFARNANRINDYLRAWRASGFRSGFMLHNLDWLHDLQIDYDASTFDTDPFEPQSEGHHTIFPFWLRHDASNAARGQQKVGYVELPYTLPQDSTLFLVLRERSPQIWFRKLDWIAEHGGMALLNVHPDYVRFDGQRQSSRNYPVEHYRNFLEYVRLRYGNQFWQPLPKNLAAFVRSKLGPSVQRSPKRDCLLAHSFYESNNV